MGTPPEVPASQADQPRPELAEGRTSLPVYYKLEKIVSHGSDMNDEKIACNGMPFAATYLGFWELHSAFLEAIRTNQLQGNAKQIMEAAKQKARERFIAMYQTHPRFTADELGSTENFGGYLFMTGVTNGTTLFVEWTKTPEGKGEMEIAAMVGGLRGLLGLPEENVGSHAEA